MVEEPFLQTGLKYDVDERIKELEMLLNYYLLIIDINGHFYGSSNDAELTRDRKEW